CPDHRGSADDVRSAFDRPSLELGGDALPLINYDSATCDRRPRRLRARWRREVPVSYAVVVTGKTATFRYHEIDLSLVPPIYFVHLSLSDGPRFAPSSPLQSSTTWSPSPISGISCSRHG